MCGGLCCAVVDREGDRARPDSCASRGSLSHTQVRGRGLYPDQRKKGGRHTPFLRELPSPVLLPHDADVDWPTVELPEGTEMVMPGRQHESRVFELIAADREWKTVLRFRDPRRWAATRVQGVVVENPRV